MRSIHVGIDTLTIKDLVELSEDDAYVELSKKTIDQVEQSAEFVDAIIENGKITYGINTGFGPLCNTIISKEDTSKLQDNILRSHSVGVGNPIEPKIAKMMLVLKLQALSMGFSGVQKTTLQRIEFFINQYNSCGARTRLSRCFWRFSSLLHIFSSINWVGRSLLPRSKNRSGKNVSINRS